MTDSLYLVGHAADVIPVADLRALAALLRSVRHAQVEAHALLERFDAGLISFARLVDELRALAVRHSQLVEVGEAREQ